MSKITAAQIATQQVWQTPTPATGWTAFDAGGAGNYGGPQYMKDTLGFVHLRGLAQNISGATKTAASLIFTLPAGYRPYQNYFITTISSDVSSRVDVTNTGLVSVGFSSSTPSNGWISLNNVIFLAEN